MDREAALAVECRVTRSLRPRQTEYLALPPLQTSVWPQTCRLPCEMGAWEDKVRISTEKRRTDIKKWTKGGNPLVHG